MLLIPLVRPPWPLKLLATNESCCDNLLVNYDFSREMGPVTEIASSSLALCAPVAGVGALIKEEIISTWVSK